ncbi:MAG TPA: 16S rRNA (cytosine(1402)-N(4))-methyltransferase RsmH [Firmicutes bacterium]|nr:16S rRNA (cytosine(1402)-N(4))-methyltransferase RsmH [Bacillota bacterium]
MESPEKMPRHIPVMLPETLRFLRPGPGKIFVDATLGMGGHARAILEQTPGGKLIGLDRDAGVLAEATRALGCFGKSFIPVKANFVEIDQVLERLQIGLVDGCLFDLGVSSYQLDTKERGFSYRDDVLLDMRMDQDLPCTAADLLQKLSTKELANLFRIYGEERWALRIAKFIAGFRLKHGPVERSSQLVEIIRAAIPAAARRRGGHPAKRVFQALRIAVNKELDNLSGGLAGALRRLRPGGRIVVLSYHSLEDRIVKRAFREGERGCVCPPGAPICTCGKTPFLKILTRKVLFPGDEERGRNPRAASARLRAAEKLLNQ